MRERNDWGCSRACRAEGGEVGDMQLVARFDPDACEWTRVQARFGLPEHVEFIACRLSAVDEGEARRAAANSCFGSDA